MAKVTHPDYIQSITGATAKGGAIFRQKHFRIDDKGHTIAGPKEVYIVTNPRDFHKHPTKAGEQQNQSNFAQAVQQVKKEMADPVRLAYWTQRFERQLTHPEAPNKKSYRVLRAFIQAMILRDIKQVPK